MKKVLWFWRSLVWGSLVVLLAIPIKSYAGGPIDGPIVISAESQQEVYPSVAYNSQWQEYLVVLWNDRPGCDDIRAERVARDGTRLGGRWIAAGCPAEHRYPDVAYNSQSNDYLVVWLEEDGGLSTVKAQRLWADGEFKGGQITVFAGVIGAQTSAHPAVAYASTTDKYLVVWELEVFIPTPAPGHTVTSIVGRSVDSDGNMPSPEFVISQDPGTEPRQQPDLAYNRHANGFLVVWQQWNGSAVWDIYGQLVNGDGSIPPGFLPIQVAWYIQSSTAPAVAAIPTAAGSYKYLVVWEATVGPGNRDIYGKLVEENGTPHASAFPISNAPADESAPAVAGDEASQRYLVTWRHPLGVVDVPIHGRAVSTDGNLLYGDAEFGGPTANYPAVAAGPVGDFFIAWQDQPVFFTDTNIYGQLWGNRVYLPLVLRGH
ncbi:MAG: hypothetical protein KJ638_00090 [Chloroflexi bacterium]|nr:hypothetical protein [Chloroflexota bacterium]